MPTNNNIEQYSLSKIPLVAIMHRKNKIFESRNNHLNKETFYANHFLAYMRCTYLFEDG